MYLKCLTSEANTVCMNDQFKLFCLSLCMYNTHTFYVCVCVIHTVHTLCNSLRKETVKQPDRGDLQTVVFPVGFARGYNWGEWGPS